MTAPPPPCVVETRQGQGQCCNPTLVSFAQEGAEKNKAWVQGKCFPVQHRLHHTTLYAALGMCVCWWKLLEIAKYVMPKLPMEFSCSCGHFFIRKVISQDTSISAVFSIQSSFLTTRTLLLSMDRQFQVSSLGCSGCVYMCVCVHARMCCFTTYTQTLPVFSAD